jgi:hypothetical protein
MSTDATPAAAPQAQFKQAHALSRKMIGEVLQIPEPSIGKMEKQIDMYLSMLRSHIEAMGGTLEVSVNMPSGKVTVTSLSGPS